MKLLNVLPKKISLSQTLIIRCIGQPFHQSIQAVNNVPKTVGQNKHTGHGELVLQSRVFSQSRGHHGSRSRALSVQPRFVQAHHWKNAESQLLLSEFLQDITLKTTRFVLSPLSVGWMDGVVAAAAIDAGALPAELMGKGTKSDNHSHAQWAHKARPWFQVGHTT